MTIHPFNYRKLVLTQHYKNLIEMHSYGCLMAVLPDELSKQIIEWSKQNIKETHLHDKGLELDPHVTIKYGFIDDSEDTLNMLRMLLLRNGPIKIKLKTLSLFKGTENGDVLKIGVESSDLVDLHILISSLFPCYDTYKEYQPHITLAYLHPNFSASYTALLAPFLNQEILIHDVKFNNKKGIDTKIPLSFVREKKAMSAYAETSGGALVPPAKQNKKPKVNPSPFQYRKDLNYDQSAIEFFRKDISRLSGTITPGTPFQGPSGRWFVVKIGADGKKQVTPAPDPTKQKGGAKQKTSKKQPEPVKKGKKQSIEDTWYDIHQIVNDTNPVEISKIEQVADALSKASRETVRSLAKEWGIGANDRTLQEYVQKVASRLIDKLIQSGQINPGSVAPADKLPPPSEEEMKKQEGETKQEEKLPTKEEIQDQIKQEVEQQVKEKLTEAGVETPEAETPEAETPEAETPEAETPEAETPEVSKAEDISEDQFEDASIHDRTLEDKDLQDFTSDQLMELYEETHNQWKEANYKGDKKLADSLQADLDTIADAIEAIQSVEGEETQTEEPKLSDKLKKKFSDILNEQNISEEAKKEYQKNLDELINALPEKAQEKLFNNVSYIKFFNSNQELNDYVNEIPEIKQKLNGRNAAAAWNKKKMILYLDGNSKKQNIRDIYAHIVSHALNTVNEFGEREYSSTPEWKDSFESEFQNEQLSKYAANSPHEAFAEFGRLVYGQNASIAGAKEKFPKASAIWEDSGLLPQESPEQESVEKLPEIFDGPPIEAGPVETIPLLTNSESISEKTNANNEILEGGLADNTPDSAFDPTALKEGIKVEMEHTNEPEEAKEIAEDHLTENSEYYEKLKEIEKPQEEPLQSIEDVKSKIDSDIQKISDELQTEINQLPLEDQEKYNELLKDIENIQSEQISTQGELFSPEETQFEKPKSETQLETQPEQKQAQTEKEKTPTQGDLFETNQEQPTQKKKRTRNTSIPKSGLENKRRPKSKKQEIPVSVEPEESKSETQAESESDEYSGYSEEEAKAQKQIDELTKQISQAIRDNNPELVKQLREKQRKIDQEIFGSGKSEESKTTEPELTTEESTAVDEENAINSEEFISSEDVKERQRIEAEKEKQEQEKQNKIKKLYKINKIKDKAQLINNLSETTNKQTEEFDEQSKKINEQTEQQIKNAIFRSLTDDDQLKDAERNLLESEQNYSTIEQKLNELNELKDSDLDEDFKNYGLTTESFKKITKQAQSAIYRRENHGEKYTIRKNKDTFYSKKWDVFTETGKKLGTFTTLAKAKMATFYYDDLESNKNKVQNAKLKVEIQKFPHKVLKEKFSNIFSKQNIKEETKKIYQETMNKVLDSLPKKTAKLIASTIQDAKFYETTTDLNNAYLQESSGQHDDAAKRGLISGMYKYGKGELLLNGQHHLSSDDNTQGTYAHEVTHALDEALGIISLNPQWVEVYSKEFQSGQLGDYAASQPIEAFAEFGRYLYGPKNYDLDFIRKKFPKASAMWEQLGIFPEDSSKRNLKGELPEIFEGDPIYTKDGLHADPKKQKSESGFDEVDLDAFSLQKENTRPMLITSTSRQSNNIKQSPFKDRTSKPAGEKVKSEFISKAVKQIGGMATASKELAKKLTNPIWNKLSPKQKEQAAKIYSVGKAIEHKAMFAFSKSKKIVEAIALEKGYTKEQAERTAKILSIADTVMAWTVNFPMVTAATGNPLIGKAASFMPLASMSYIVLSTARNPLMSYKMARKAIREKGNAGKALSTNKYSQEDIAALIDLMENAQDPDWTMALILAALDEYQYNLSEAIRVVKSMPNQKQDV